MGALIWLTGFENYQIDNGPLSSLMEKKEEAFSHFLSKDGRKIPNHYFLSSFYTYLIEKHDNVDIKVEGKVIDVLIKGEKIRFITDNLTANETEVYIINAPSKVNIVIGARPRNITKKEIEEQITILHRLSVDVPIPKPSNLIKLLSPHSWTWDCFIKKFSEALFAIIVEIVSNVFANIILRMIFQ